MAGSTEERFDALSREIADLEAQRNDHGLVIEALSERGWDTAAAKAVLKRIEDQIAALRARTATFEGDSRHI